MILIVFDIIVVKLRCKNMCVLKMSLISVRILTMAIVFVSRKIVVLRMSLVSVWILTMISVVVSRRICVCGVSLTSIKILTMIIVVMSCYRRPSGERIMIYILGNIVFVIPKL